ncbi:MAG: hypothetical protein R6W88_04545 [Desulfobacterales bacterium]
MTSKKKSVGVIPVGDVPESTLQIIADHITGRFKLTTQILPPLEQPEYAFDERRLQYNAGIIIEAMEAMQFGNHDKVIGVLNKDLFAPLSRPGRRNDCWSRRRSSCPASPIRGTSRPRFFLETEPGLPS